MKNYIWMFSLLANVLIITSTNVDRTKRHLAFLKKFIANSYGSNMNNAIMENSYNIPYPYFIFPNYQILTNIIPDPYMNSNAYQGLQQKIFLPGNIVMQPVNYFQRQYVPYVAAFDDNYKTDYVNFKSSPVYGNRHRLIPVSNYNTVATPIIPLPCDKKNLVLHTKQVTEDKAREVSSALSKPERRKLQELQKFRNTEKKCKEISNKGLPTSQSSISKNIIVTPNSSRVLVKKIQRMKTSTISPNSAVNVVQNKLSSLFSATTSTTETIQISTLTPSTFNNAQELITPHPITTLTTSLASVNKADNSETVQPIIFIPEKIDKDIQSTSPESIPVIISNFKELGSEDENNNKNNPSNTSKIVIQTSTLTPPTFTNDQESTTSDGMTTLTTSLPPALKPFKSVDNLETVQPIIPQPEKIDEKIKSTSMLSNPVVNSVYKEPESEDEINMKNTLNETSKKLIQIINLTLLNFTNAQESTTSHTMATLTTSLPLPQTSAKNVENSVTAETIIPTPKKIGEEIQLISTVSIPVITSDYKEPDSEDEINNRNNPSNASMKLIEMSPLTPPTFTNAQESTTLNALSTLTTSLPPPLTSVKSVENSETAQPIIPKPKKIDADIQSTSTVSIPVITSDYKKPDSEDEINNKNNTSTTSIKLIRMSTLTPSTFTNAQESKTSHAMWTLTTSLPSPLTSAKNVENSETAQPIILKPKKIDEDIQSTSTVSIPVITSDYKEPDSEDEINNKNNPSTTSIKLIHMSTLTPPTFTNAQKSTTSHAMSTLTTSLPSPLTSVKNVDNAETAQPIIHTPKKIDEDIQSTSTVSIPVITSDYKESVSADEINNKNNSSSTLKKLIQMSTLTPPTYTNAQESITSHAISTLTTSLPPLLTSVKNVENSETVQPIIPTPKKIDEDIQSTSTVSIPVIISDYKGSDSEDEINNKNNPSTTSIKLIHMSTLTPPTFTNEPESITPYALTLGSTLISSTSPLLLLVTNEEKVGITQPTMLPFNKLVQETNSTSTSTPTINADYNQPINRDEINNKFNPHNTSNIVRFTEPIQTQFLYKKVNSSKTKEDPVFKMENIKYPNASESQSDLMDEPSIFNHIIDILNSIAPIRGKVLNRPNIFIPEDETDTNDVLEERNMDDLEKNNQSTEVYPSESEESDYLKRSPIVLDDDPTYVPEGSGSGSNDHFDDSFSWSIPSDSDRDISRGDVPDVCCE